MCPCCSGKMYVDCCKRFHNGADPENALQLMRSRYSGYALRQAAYMIKTTDLDNPNYKKNHEEWTKEILQFCQRTRFDKLEIIEFVDGNDVAFVTFIAYLTQGNADVSFTEKSRFRKVNGKWLYHSGVVTPLSRDGRD